MTRRNRDADLLSHRLDRAAGIIPTIREHLDEQRTLVQALPARGEGGRQVGTHSDPTLRTTMRLENIDRDWLDITDALASINVGVNLLEKACAKALGATYRAAAEEEPRCNGGDPSSWGDPECGQLLNWDIAGDHVSYRDYCPRHERQRSEWEAGAPERERASARAKAKRRQYHAVSE